MAEHQHTPTKTPVKKGALITTAVVAAIAGAGGGYVSGGTQGSVPSDAIRANVEHNITFSTGITGLEAVAMNQDGLMIHTRWNYNPRVKAYNLYLDGKKYNKLPILAIGEYARYTINTDLVAGKTYSVTITYFDINGKESAPSTAVQVTT